MSDVVAELRALLAKAASVMVLSADGGFAKVEPAILGALLDVAEAARDLHAEVEMCESIGICLQDREPSLRLAAAVARLDGEPDA